MPASSGHTAVQRPSETDIRREIGGLIMNPHIEWSRPHDNDHGLTATDGRLTIVVAAVRFSGGAGVSYARIGWQRVGEDNSLTSGTLTIDGDETAYAALIGIHRSLATRERFAAAT